MDSILFVTKDKIESSCLRDKIIAYGGRWLEDPTLNCGVVSYNDAIIYVSCPYGPETEYDDAEIGTFTKLLGDCPQSVVCIDIGRGEGSVALARAIGGRLVAEWGGIIDPNGVWESIEQ